VTASWTAWPCGRFAIGKRKIKVRDGQAILKQAIHELAVVRPGRAVLIAILKGTPPVPLQYFRIQR
jgi:hypothetical protein